MKRFKTHTLKFYLESLASRNPVPGGGSAAALTAALGVGLIEMAAHYSKGKAAPNSASKKLTQILRRCHKIRQRLLELVDLDAMSYLALVKARKAKPAVRRKARAQARKVPREVCRLCYQAVDMTPFLVKNGNRNLLSDIEVALELLMAAFHSAKITADVNQE